MKRAIPAAAFLALLTTMSQQACRHPADPEMLAATEKMIRRTDSMRRELDNMDTAGLRHMEALFESERSAIEMRFKDTLSKDEAMILGNYHRAMAVTLPRVLDDRRRIRQRLDSLHQQLADLRHDLGQGLLKKNDQRQAMVMEQAWDSTLAQDVERLRADIGQLEQDRRKYRSAIDPLLHP
jgi:hypothetical protein